MKPCQISKNRRISVAGFTLIEVMVVVFVIGLMIAVVGVNLSPNIDRHARLEARRFQAVVNEVRDESIISGESFFLVLLPKSASYSFVGVRSDRNTSQDEGLFRVRAAYQGVELDWTVFEQIENEEGERQERVLITPLGEITPFDAEFKGKEFEYHVFINDEYELEVKTENAQGF